MSYKVIAEFVDRRNGARVLPGNPLPEGLDDETIARLVRARCLMVDLDSFRGKKADDKKSTDKIADGKSDKSAEPAKGKADSSKAVAGGNDSPGRVGPKSKT